MASSGLYWCNASEPCKSSRVYIPSQDLKKARLYSLWRRNNASVKPRSDGSSIALSAAHDFYNVYPAEPFLLPPILQSPGTLPKRNILETQTLK